MADITRLFNKLAIVRTEDTGKEFEMSICLAYGIEYVGKYKYSLIHQPGLEKLPGLFPGPIQHIAKNGSRYDFVSTSTGKYLSAKSTKKGDKVCPQVIGQMSKKKFRDYFCIPDDQSIKEYTLLNAPGMMEKYFDHTFDADIIYYNKKKDEIKFIQRVSSIDFSSCNLLFSRPTADRWNESNTLKIETHTIGEFQVHNNRDCVKFRWNIEKLLKLFPDHFLIY